jgi:hypothetical protein
LFFKFVQLAPPKDMHGLNNHNYHTKKLVRVHLYNFVKRGVHKENMCNHVTIQSDIILNRHKITLARIIKTQPQIS